MRARPRRTRAVVNVSVTNDMNILRQQGADWTRVGIEMAKPVASRL